MEMVGDIEFKCIQDECSGIIQFSLLDVEKKSSFQCPQCLNDYTFNQELTGKIRKFVELILAVRASEEILGNTSVAIDVEGHSVQVPYRLLLTRLNTLLTLKIGSKEIIFKFRVEPLKKKASL
ncbi:MAG: hypothetical protein HYS07_10245 [Chlamydiae bacterium]|nr:hypothetical protein [Chlamydiota bacterium]MBI3277046.1 hypothetical protein [Chlamydiota bacterium]